MSLTEARMPSLADKHEAQAKLEAVQPEVVAPKAKKVKLGSKSKKK